MIKGIDLLAHLEAKIEATIAAGEGTAEGLAELGHMVREIAEAALVRGDDVTLREARRLAARLSPFVPAHLSASGRSTDLRGATDRHACPRCGQRFRRYSGRLDEVGELLCQDCTAELLAGIRL